MSQREISPEREAWLRRQVAASRRDPSNGEAAMAWALDEIDRLRRDLADASELLDGLAPGPDALAREDAARDVARAWVESGEPLSRESAGALMAALDRLAAAYGLS